jgi:hypothetical protein
MQDKMFKMRAQYDGFPHVVAAIQKILDEISSAQSSRNQDWSYVFKSITDQSQDLLNTMIDIPTQSSAKASINYSCFVFFNQSPKAKKATDKMNLFLFNLGRFHEWIDPAAAKIESSSTLRIKCE